MSDFLLVIPEGWTSLDWQFVTNNLDGMSMANVNGWIGSGQLESIETPLKGAGLIPADASVVEAKLIDDAYFMVRLA